MGLFDSLFGDWRSRCPDCGSTIGTIERFAHREPDSDRTRFGKTFAEFCIGCGDRQELSSVEFGRRSLFDRLPCATTHDWSFIGYTPMDTTELVSGDLLHHRGRLKICVDCGAVEEDREVYDLRHADDAPADD